MKDVTVNYIATKTGLDTVELNDYLLHSKYDPMKEAERIVQKEHKENYVHVLFGYGLGYIADVLKLKMKNKKELIVIDPFKSILCPDNDDVLDFENIELIRAKIWHTLRHDRQDIRIICSPNYDKLAGEEHLLLLKSIKEIQYMKVVSENTNRLFNEIWQENYIKNLVCATQDASVSELYKVYSCPVVIASGGPSLTKQLPLLKKIRNQIILIASGSTINSLLHERIEPDYVVSIDGSDANYTHFKDLNLIDSTLLYSLTSNYKIQHEYTGERYAFLPLTEDKHIEHRLRTAYHIQLPVIEGGASVANSALTIAKYITSGPIALIGQDLAYTNNLSHAAHNKFQKAVDNVFYKENQAIEVEGYYGDKVMTDYPFLTMKESFEILHRRIKHSAPVFNCTEGGLKIQGYDQIPFTQFINEYVSKDEVQKVKPLKKEYITLAELGNIFAKEIEAYEKLEKLCNEAIDVLKKDENKVVFSKNTLKILNKVDKKVKEHAKEVLIYDIITPITMDVMRYFKEKENETPKERFERTYNQNKVLYSRLLEAIKKTKIFTLEAVKIIENEKGE